MDKPKKPNSVPGHAGRANAWFLLIFGFWLLKGSAEDLLGFLMRSDLYRRLKEKDSFNYVKPLDPSFSLATEYSFLVISDTHIENGNAYGLEGIKAVIDDPANGIKFAVFLGDITQTGQRGDLQKFIYIADSFGIPCFPVIGNHDVFHRNWPVWKELIGSTYYRIDSGETTLFILDSANGFFGNEQLDWLEGEIKTAGKRCFVFTHAYFYARTTTGIRRLTDIRERERFKSILKDRCDFIFTGHMHRETLRETGGVQHLTVEDFWRKKTYVRVSVTNLGISINSGKI